MALTPSKAAGPSEDALNLPIVALVSLPFLLGIPVMALYLHHARRQNLLTKAARDGVESTIHLWAGTDPFCLVCAMVLTKSASSLLGRDPIHLALWPLVGIMTLGRAYAIRRRQLLG